MAHGESLASPCAAHGDVVAHDATWPRPNAATRRQCSPCAPVRHTAKSLFAVSCPVAHGENKLRRVLPGEHTANIYIFLEFPLQFFFLLYTLTICNYILKFHTIWNSFAIYSQLSAFIFIFPDAVKFELRLSEIVLENYGKIDIHVTKDRKSVV